MDLFKTLAVNKKKNISSDDTFSNILQSWEEMLGQNANVKEDFNYSIETDQTFANAYETNKYELLKGLASVNNSIISNKFKYNEKTLNFEHTLRRDSDAFNNAFIRLKLNNDVTTDDIDDILHLLCDCQMKITIGGSDIFTIPKFLFIFLICNKFGISLNTVDMRKIHDEMSSEEINSMRIFCDDFGSIHNQKYDYNSIDDKYLDIPLLLEFFSYGAQLPVIALQYHDIVYHFTIPKHKMTQYNKYIDSSYLLFEKKHYYDSIYRKNMAQSAYELFIMQSYTSYYHGFCDEHLLFNNNSYASKFMFVLMRPHLDDVQDSTQYPQINNVIISGDDIETIEIALENIWIEQFDDILIYGIALNGNSNMNEWLNVMNEFTPIDMNKLNNNNEYIDNNNVKEFIDNNITANRTNDYMNNNPNNHTGIFNHVRYCDVQLSFTPSSTPVNMEIITINQNIQRIMGGMCGNAFNS